MTSAESQSGPPRSGPSSGVLIVGLLVAVALAGSALGWALLSAYQSSGGSADYEGLDQTLEETEAGPVGGSRSGVRPAAD